MRHLFIYDRDTVDGASAMLAKTADERPSLCPAEMDDKLFSKRK